MRFNDSVDYCESLGYQLASIHSDVEHAEAMGLCSMTKCWIGAHSIDNTDYGFYWIDGSEWNYTKWGNGEPNDWSGIEDCVEIAWNDEWNDAKCTDLRRPLCRTTPGN